MSDSLWLQNRRYGSSEEKKSKLEKGKHRSTPQISLARGRDLIEREWVNWKMLPSYCESLGVCNNISYSFILYIVYLCICKFRFFIYNVKGLFLCISRDSLGYLKCGCMKYLADGQCLSFRGWRWETENGTDRELSCVRTQLKAYFTHLN